MEEEIKGISLNKLNDELIIDGGSFTPEIPDTIEIPIIENPDDREYEDVEIEVEGGV